MLRPGSETACSQISTQPSDSAGWEARLELCFAAGPHGTRLIHNRHHGPLRLLKALVSEDGRRLEAVLVHPPGGLAGGDSLALDLRVGRGARVLATTPGAQKWYRGDATAVSSTTLTIERGAALEWLPQPAILFDRAQARQTVAIELDREGACLGWEVVIRGRGAMGESLRSGHIDQTLTISVAQSLLWQERLFAGAADRLFDSPLGWDRRPMAASVWCCAPSLAPDQLLALRDRWRALLAGADDLNAAAAPATAPSPNGGATIAASGLLLAKLLADDSERLMARCQLLWRAARMSLEGNAGSPPRIWRT
jgi:urease accessory protein